MNLLKNVRSYDVNTVQVILVHYYLMLLGREGQLDSVTRWQDFNHLQQCHIMANIIKLVKVR